MTQEMHRGALPPITVRGGAESDLESVLALLDKAVRWLVDAGRTGQWGSASFSSSPKRRNQIQGMIAAGVVRLADLDGEVVGACVLAPYPAEYVEPAEVPEMYIHLLVVDRDHGGAGVGLVLVGDAVELARHDGAEQLRVDCYAGDDGALVAAYERLGFTRSAPLLVDRPGMPPWPGQVLTRALSPSGPTS